MHVRAPLAIAALSASPPVVQKAEESKRADPRRQAADPGRQCPPPTPRPTRRRTETKSPTTSCDEGRGQRHVRDRSRQARRARARPTPSVKKFAAVDGQGSHTKSSADLKKPRSPPLAPTITLPTALSADMQGQAGRPEQAPTRQGLRQEVRRWPWWTLTRTALNLLQRYAQGGDVRGHQGPSPPPRLRRSKST
jgi:hypothetical protein